MVCLQARDDGRGAELPSAGNGLRGMRERLAAYGGRVDIRTAPGQGFELDIVLTLDDGIVVPPPSAQPSIGPAEASVAFK